MTVTQPSLYRRIKRRTYEILEGAVPDKASTFCEVFIAMLVVANVVGIILESVPEIHEAYEAAFHAFDLFSVAVFSLEYVLRVWSYREIQTRRRYGLARSQRVHVQLLRFGRFFQYRAVLFATAISRRRFARAADVPIDANFQTLALQQRV